MEKRSRAGGAQGLARQGGLHEVRSQGSFSSSRIQHLGKSAHGYVVASGSSLNWSQLITACLCKFSVLVLKRDVRGTKESSRNRISIRLRARKSSIFRKAG
jgi:hypothetical protein